MTLSNSQVLSEHFEHVASVLRGVDFGPRTFVVARAPKSALLWLGGHSWSVNGNVSYAESHMILIKDRTPEHFAGVYRNIGSDGGRLSVARMVTVKDIVTPHLGEENWDALLYAVRKHKTLLIEGGGDEFMPSHTRGRDAVKDWMQRYFYTGKEAI